MAAASVTIELDLPDGVEIREYQRHGDGHAFHVAWPPPDRCRCDGCTQEGPTRLDAKPPSTSSATWTSGASPASGSTNRHATTAPTAAGGGTCCPHSSAATSPTHTASSGTSWPVSLAALRRVAQRLGIAAETVALIVANQIADQGAKQVDPGASSGGSAWMRSASRSSISCARPSSDLTGRAARRSWPWPPAVIGRQRRSALWKLSEAHKRGQ